MILKRSWRGLAALITVVSVALTAGAVVATSPAQANSIEELSEVAQEAFADLTTCIRSSDEPTMDVFYLVDESDSLLNTDPEVVREEILSGSILQLASFAEQGIQVNVGAALFSTSVTPVFDWQTIGNEADASNTAGALSSAIRGSAVQTGAVKWTNWEAGLEYASQQLDANNPDQAHCQALIWFTDGGIRLGNDKDLSLPSLANLCHSGISATNLQRGPNDSFGLMASFKERNIGVFAVLFRNEQALRSGWEARGSSPQEIEELVGDFRYFASFMLPLVEGSGEIYPDYTPPNFPSGGTLECADLGADGKALPGQSNGAFLDAEDPITLAFQFLKLQAEISGGDSKEIGDGGRFQIAPGTAAFRILTTSFDWTLEGPDGENRALPNSGAPAVNVNQRTGVTTISIDIRDETDIGEWTFAPQEETTFSSLYVFAGLTIDLDREQETPVVLGRDNTLSGQVLRQPQFANLGLDLSVYQSNELRLEVITADGLQPIDDVTIEPPDPNTGSFRIDGFNPGTSFGDRLDVQLTLSVGGDFEPIKSRFSLNVLSSGAFPLLENSVVVLSPLEGPEGIAEGEMVISPPTEVAAGEFCISTVPKRVSDPQETAVEPIDRASDWNWTFSAAGPTDNREASTCFVVAQSDGPFVVSVQARNPIQADSMVESLHVATSGNQGEPPLFGEDIVFEFESRTQQSAGVFLGVFIGLLILGVLLPLALLYLFNRLASRFAWADGMVRAEYPVAVSLGLFSSISDRTTGAPLSVGPQDFKFLADRRNPRAVEDEPHGYPVSRVPLFPLSATWSEWIANLGTRVVSSYEGSTRSGARFANGKVAEISPRMSDNWALIFNEQELVSSEEEGPVPATLVIYSEMKDLAGYQSRLRDIETSPDLADKIKAVRSATRQEVTAAPSGGQTGGGTIPPPTTPPPAPTGPPPTPTLNLPGAPPPPAQ